MKNQLLFTWIFSLIATIVCILNITYNPGSLSQLVSFMLLAPNAFFFGYLFMRWLMYHD